MGRDRAAKIFLVSASLFFYSWWHVIYLPLIIGSVLFNFWVGTELVRTESGWLSRKRLLQLAIAANVILLAYFKYSDFFIENINGVFNSDIQLLNLVLPLAISFFTFQQIAYLVDSYRREVKDNDFLNYAVFVTFFPQLIAGPIVHHKEMMPQFINNKNNRINSENLYRGLFIFSIGLFKKVMIADTFAVWATAGYDESAVLYFYEAWATSWAYTFQLYFDFSGYTDMAIGLGLLFNIRLPENFNSPYQARNIQDFWRRWHITLSRFLRDYVYIPLGGNQSGPLKIYINLMLTFLIGGIWHGAGWTFIFWGFLHGMALCIHRLWCRLGISMWSWLAWLITLNFVNIAWVFFRAETWADAQKVLTGMFGLTAGEDYQLSLQMVDSLSHGFNMRFYEWVPFTFRTQYVPEQALLLSLLALFMVVGLKNNNRYIQAEVISMRLMCTAAFAFGLSVIHSMVSTSEVFLYFNF